MKIGRKITLILLAIFFIGLSLLLYPSISSYWNSITQSKVVEDYDAMLKSLTPKDYSDIFAAAEDYNTRLAALDFPLMEHTALTEDYNSALNAFGDGVMGYIDIDKIQVKLPIYHGVSDGVLSHAVAERGIEGAVALRMSRDAVDALIDGKGVGLMVDLKPGLTEEMLRERIAREMAEMGPEEFFSELLRKLVPKALVIPLSEEVGAHSKNYIRKITPEQIERLVKLLKGMVFPISDYAPFEYAVVTAGGVSCEDVNRYTMESLKVKGLYFAGEVLDLDANTGGYNLQIAFSTGRLAGMLKQ